MASMTNTRAGLMLTSGAAALALSLAISTEKAQAQAFQASETIVSGSATRLPTGTGTETITIDSQTVVIDWTPSIDAATGNALDFLPTGAIATFQNNGSDNPGGNFAVLNRILPTQTGDVVVMDGTVISRIVDLQFGTSTPGGTIAFYSPTGILVGGNASFDVGNLILTTLEPDVASFENFFLNGGTMFLDAGDAQLAEIIINAGANITASAENSYFAAIGARVRMDGTADINGSHAYVAGRTVNLTFSNGLFDIEVPVGTARSGSVINLRGNVGGPSSTGAGDNHMIYAVARASDNPIDLLFRGNLGFDPAASAGVVNGEIILSANYDVFGRTVQNGSISEGIGAVFDAQPDPFASPIAEANITAAALSASSSLLAIGTDVVEFNAGESSIFVDGNLLLVGRERALARASEGTIDVTGDLLISARNYGLVGSEFQDPGLIDAVGGEAILEAFFNSDITIGGSALVTASARGGADAFNFVAGSATGGRALVAADGGTISILGDTTIDAGAAGATEISLITTGATSRGGEALAFAQNGGLLTLGGNVIIDTSAIGVNADTSDVSTGSDAIGGFSSLDVTGSDGGTIDIAGEVGIFSNALGGTSNGEGAGSLGQGGDAGIFIDGAGSVTIGGAVNQEANGRGGDNFGSGSGGEARGGSARTFLPAGGSLAVGGDLAMRADAFGGNGTGGGDAFGGAAGIEVLTGIAEIAGTAAASASAQGGNADFGFGGAGGNAFGGLAFIQATGTLAASATLNAGGASAFARASGGRGGAGDGSDFQPGRGGDGSGGDFATPNQAAPEFINGAFVLAGGDNGNLAITGENVVVDASGEGGEGGSGSTGQAGGAGGVGQGGLAQAGSTLFGGDGSLGAGSVGFGGVTVEAGGIGGVGGTGDQTGDGGEGRGGSAAFSVRAGELTAGTVELLADGFGGDGGQGGSALGGDAGLLGGLGGVATLDSLLASALAEGGAGATGGDALGGEAFMAFEGLDLTVNNGALLDASGLGGAGATGNGGNATGGTSRLEVRDSTLELTGISRLGDQTAGGDGETGGEAIGGIIEFFAVNSAITALPDVEGFAGLLVGGGTIGGQGVLQGGAATGSAITVGIEGSTFSGGTLGIVADARGGTATGGESLGGAATGGTVSFSTNPSTIGLVGENVVSADAFGGDGTTAGTAFGGSVEVAFNDTDLTIASDGQAASLVVRALAVGGEGAGGGTAGTGLANLGIVNSSLVADQLFVQADSTSATSASGGSATLGIDGNSLVEVGEVLVSADGTVTGNGQSAGGFASLIVGPTGGEILRANNLGIRASGAGGDSANEANTAGSFRVEMEGGLIEVATFEGFATGDVIAQEEDIGSVVSAIGGDFLVSDSFVIDARDDVVIETGGGGFIGGPTLADPTVAINITSRETIAFLGDDDAAIGFGGLSMALTSRDVVIESGARIGAETMEFLSLDTLDPAVLGGEGTPGGIVTGEGYTLVAQELDRLEVGSFTFTQPDLVEPGAGQPTIILRDVAVTGSADGGTSNLLIRTDGSGGIIRVEGFIDFANAQVTDRIALEAAERIEVVTPGGIAITDGDLLPTGELSLSARNIWVADADLIADLQADRSFAGRDDRLATAFAGSDDPLGYLRAGQADIVIGQSLLVRNTGTATEQGGILVGEGGLSIQVSEGAQATLDVFAYGRSQNADGTFVTGSDFFSDVNFNDGGSTNYTAQSEFNDCVITTGECPAAVVEPPPPEEPGEPALLDDPVIADLIAASNNPALIEDPVELPPEEIPLTEQESDEAFGADFPGLIEAPLLSEDPLLDDPVASGGDSSTYGGGAAPEGSDDE